MPPAPRNRRRPILLAALCVLLGLLTSVGVAWAVAWNRDSFSISNHPDTGVVLLTGDGGQTMPFAWSVTQWSMAPLSVNYFWVMPRNAARDYLAQQSMRFNVDAAERFSTLANDAASRRALTRHLPLIQDEDAEYVVFSVDRSGWPFLALAAERACTREDALAEKRHMYLSNGPTNSPSRVPNPNATIANPAFNLLPHYNAIEIGNTLLPTFPLWPGLFANTAIYGGAWAVLIGSPILLLRWLRSRKGGCVQCGYSREGLKVDATCPECGRVPTSIAAPATPATPQTPAV